MNEDELMNERRMIYETRLGILGYGPGEIPEAWAHNAAVAEADEHIAQLRRQKENQTAQAFEEMRKAL